MSQHPAVQRLVERQQVILRFSGWAILIDLSLAFIVVAVGVVLSGIGVWGGWLISSGAYTLGFFALAVIMALTFRALDRARDDCGEEIDNG